MLRLSSQFMQPYPINPDLNPLTNLNLHINTSLITSLVDRPHSSYSNQIKSYFKRPFKDIYFQNLQKFLNNNYFLIINLILSFASTVF